jgi:hypothetical protein
MKINLKYLLFIFPAAYLLLGFYLRQIFGDLSLRSTDPDYLHFLSGMCISTGQFNEANIDHPGSALQVLLAGVFRVVYLFRERTHPYFEDAMLNSDLYLAVGNLVITILLAGTILWAGIAVFKITKNYVYALLIQTGPFLIDIWYEIYGRIYPELLILIPVLIIQVQILKTLYDKNHGKLNDVLILSFAVALGMSLKMTFLPFIIIPLFLIPSLKKKTQYLLFTVIFFFVISIPVTFQMERFWNWMKGIFIHSGMYQSGEKNIIDPAVFISNLQKLWQSEKTFFIALSALLVMTVVIIFLKNRHTDKKRRFILIAAGLYLMFAASVFIVAKQFAVRYFIPALLFYPLLLVLINETVKLISLNKYIITVTHIIIAVIILMNLKNQLPYVRITSEGVGSFMEARKHSRSFISTLENDSYKIIVSQDYGSPYKEYAIMYSFCVAGGGWPGYREKLDRIYPNTYQYFTWDNTIKYWGKEFNPLVIAESDKPVYLYLEKNSEDLYNKTIDRLFENNPEFIVESKLLFENSKTGEGILQLFFKLK